MAKCFSFFLFLLLSAPVFAQDIAVLQDRQGYSYYFDQGVIEKLELTQLSAPGTKPQLLVDGGIILYKKTKGITVLYRDGEKKVLTQKGGLDDFQLVENTLISTANNALGVMEGTDWKTISLDRRKLFAFGDGFIAFIDYDDYLKVYQAGQIKDTGYFDVSILGASDESAAFTDDTGQVFWYINNEVVELDVVYPQATELGNNYVLFNDEYEAFMMAYDGKVSELEPYPPNSRQLGDEIFAYVNDDGDFKVFSEGVLETVDVETPKDYQIVGNTLYYVDSQNYFKVFENGKTHDLESFRPERILIDEEVVVYQDLRGYLWAFYEGEKIKVADDIVQSFELQGKVITYYNNSRNPMVYWKGNTFWP